MKEHAPHKKVPQDKNTRREPTEKIAWKAPEFFHFHKEDSWYFISFLISAIFLVIAIWQRNFFFAIFVIIAEALVLHFAHQKPRTLQFTIDEHGIEIESDKFYPFSALKSFWIRPKIEQFDELVIATNSIMKPHLKIFLGPEISEKVRAALKQRLEEKEHHDSFIELLAEWIGF